MEKINKEILLISNKICGTKDLSIPVFKSKCKINLIKIEKWMTDNKLCSALIGRTTYYNYIIIFDGLRKYSIKKLMNTIPIKRVISCESIPEITKLNLINTESNKNRLSFPHLKYYNIKCNYTCGNDKLKYAIGKVK